MHRSCKQSESPKSHGRRVPSCTLWCWWREAWISGQPGYFSELDCMLAWHSIVSNNSIPNPLPSLVCLSVCLLVPAMETALRITCILTIITSHGSGSSLSASCIYNNETTARGNSNERAIQHREEEYARGESNKIQVIPSRVVISCH